MNRTILPPYRALLILFLMPGLPGTLFSQEEPAGMYQGDTIDTSADIFDDREPMHVTLTFDIKKYQREKFKGEYMPVHFRYQALEGGYPLQGIKGTRRLRAERVFVLQDL